MLKQIKASAGSGKTYTLTTEYLQILKNAHHTDQTPACSIRDAKQYYWPEILAVTFTNKAAAEMKERIIIALKEQALTPNKGPASHLSQKTAVLWLTRILQNQQYLNIRTIDSLLALLMRIFALQAGLTPDFDVIFSAKETTERAFAELCRQAENGDEKITALLQTAFDTMLHREQRPGFIMGGAFRKRLAELVNFRLENSTLFTHTEKDIQKVIDTVYNTFYESFIALDRLCPPSLDYALHFKNFMEKCREQAEEKTIPTSAMASKQSFVQCVLKKNKDRVTKEQETAYAQFKKSYERAKKSIKLLTTARNWSGFAALAEQVALHTKKCLIRENLLLNDLCPDMVLQFLRGDMGVPEAFCRLGASLRYMLVDEFQDTSRKQWQAMSPLAEECLATGGGVAVLGDLKQAIYSWRGGDARLFDEVISSPPLPVMADPTLLNLPCNWRSSSRIVEFNNAVFGSLESLDKAQAVAAAMLGKTAQEEPETEQTLGHTIARVFAGARQQLPQGREKSGHVCLIPLLAKDAEELRQKTEAYIQKLFSELIKRHKPGHIAVLVRTNYEANLVAHWLMAIHLPVITENSLYLAGHPVVRELIAFLRLTDYPLDDRVFWEFISGEIFTRATGLEKTDLYHWLLKKEKIPLSLRFEQDYPELYHKYLAGYMKKAGFVTPYDLVAEAAAHFEVLYHNPHAAPFFHCLLELLHICEQKGRLSVATFLDFWDKEGSKEKIPLPESIDAVKIMTIHKAKGLEFPVVVMPFHHWANPKSNLPLTAFTAFNMQLIAPRCKEMGDIYWQEEIKNLLEQLNLLYVGWTRAVDELHCVFGNTKKSLQESPILRALEPLLSPLGFSSKTPLTLGTPAKDSIFEKKDTVIPDSHAPADLAAQPMSWLPRLKIFHHFHKDQLGQSLEKDHDLPPKKRGTIIHEALETTHAQNISPETAIHAAMVKHAPTLRAEAQKQLLHSAIDIINWVKKEPALAPLIKQGTPECTLLDEKGKEHRPDLLVLTDQESVVVDYKTGQKDPDHAKQIKRYLGLLKKMPGLPKKKRGILVYLDKRSVEEVFPA